MEKYFDLGKWSVLAPFADALALQNSLSNLASGILLIVSKPFLKGDYVISAGMEGTIDSIDLLHTTLISADNKKIIVPNSSLTSNNVINANGMPTRRVDK